MSPPRLFGAFRDPLKNGRPTDGCTQQFSRGLGIIRIKRRHLKSAHKWANSGRLDLNGLDIEGLKAAQRNQLIVPGKNIAFSSKLREGLSECRQTDNLINEAYISDLGFPEAFCNYNYEFICYNLLLIT